MGRKFTPHTMQFLEDKIDQTGCYVSYGLTSQVNKDISKVEFDFENYEDTNGSGYNGCETITGFNVAPNGLPFLGISAGGDWEIPVFFIVYWDGKKLRGYIPTDGNMWNTDTKTAYGNDYDKIVNGKLVNSHSDGKNIKKRWPDRYHVGTEYEVPDEDIESDDADNCDTNLILNDIIKRITPR